MTVSPPPTRWYRGPRVVLWFLVFVVLVAGAFYAVIWHMTAGFRREQPLAAVARAGQDSGALAQRLGVAIYPGAQFEPSQMQQVLGQQAVVLLLTTPDPAAQVMNYYHQHYPDADLEDADGETWLLQFVGKDHFAIHALTEDGRTTIEIALLPS